MLNRQVIAFAVLFVLTPLHSAEADPCGMVPPIYTGAGTPIARIGIQKTYVFYKNGMETFVIRPGFRGKVEDFGMLIPFPSPPSVRKVPDDVLSHVAAAIDPPEVVVDLRQRAWRDWAAFSSVTSYGFSMNLAIDQVQVLREEAVGMYEVAVLQAGSAGALRSWMDAHGYRFPKGMEATCNDYVKESWCFVAVKTRVAAKGLVDARPGMREVNPALPAGAQFDGYVQAMGFRFKVDELVVPMRLSAFNEGDLRNVVYLLSGGPYRIRSLPETLVVRQISGWELYENVTNPLPLKILGGTIDQIPEWRRKGLNNEQDPGPHNGFAKDLFAADLLAARTGRLSHEHEEAEKDLLRIGEELGLRGPAIDGLISKSLAEIREAASAKALRDLHQMTMTVIDGDFPREFIAKENLRFDRYQMPSNQNLPAIYDAKFLGKPVKYGGAGPTGGSLLEGGLRLWLLFGLLLVTLTICVRFLRRRRSAAAATSLVLLVVALGCGSASAQELPDRTVASLLQDLGDAKHAPEAARDLVARGDKAISELQAAAAEDPNLHRRGWALVCLSRIGGKEIDAWLATVHGRTGEPVLVRTWAAAARVKAARTRARLLALGRLANEFPALARPWGQAFSKLGAFQGKAWIEEAIELSIAAPALAAAISGALQTAPTRSLVKIMVTAEDQGVRRQAAAWVASPATQGRENVSGVLIRALRFDPEAVQVPWAGGPLFLPALPWERPSARELVGHLIRWHLWCELRARQEDPHPYRELQQQIHNNIRSLNLARVAGYASPAWANAGTEAWLTIWGNAVGKRELRQLLEEQGAVRLYEKLL